MRMRTLGGTSVSAIGLGCMNLDHAYGPATNEEDGARLLLTALDLGCNFLDTATLYGAGRNEERIGRVLGKHRSRFILASKCGMAIIPVDGKLQRVIDGRPSTLRRQCEESLTRLKTDCIDLYYLHRWDKTVPIEESVGALADLVAAGKIRHIGLSEVSAATLRRAHKVHPIAALQTEYSLWTRNPEIAVLNACRDTGTTFVAFSPLARAFLSGNLKDVTQLDAKDIRRAMPRFGGQHMDANRLLLAPFLEMARDLACSPSQLALAWLLHKDSHVIPIPGTTKSDHLLENIGALNVELRPHDMQRLEQMINSRVVSGPRYDEQASAEVDTEEFAIN